MSFFSIIIPTYNSASTLHKCLESVLGQTFKDFEVLIIDGVSTDNTIEITMGFNDNRIRIISEPDNGIYDAMNKGIKLAKGEWLYFLGSDDTLFKINTLRNIFEIVVNNCYDVIYGNVMSTKHGGIYNGEWKIDMIGYNICHQAIFYKKELMLILGGFNVMYKISADHDLNIKWFLNKKYKYCYTKEIIANFSDGGYSSIQNDNLFDNDMNYLIFIRGIGYFNIDILKEYAYRAYLDKKKQKKNLMCLFLKTTIYFIWFISLIDRVFKIK